jgi:hypothetical protein
MGLGRSMETPSPQAPGVRGFGQKKMRSTSVWTGGFNPSRGPSAALFGRI